MHDVYQVVGSLVVGWCLNSVWDWFKHCFWVGFKTGLSEQMRLGRKLTPEESEAMKTKLNAQLTAEFQKKLLKVADVVSDDEPLKS